MTPSEFFPPRLAADLAPVAASDAPSLVRALPFPQDLQGNAALRRMGAAAAPLMPPILHRTLTSTAKWIRGRVSGESERPAPPAMAARLRSGARFGASPRLGVLLTHDLDTQRCVDELGGVLDVERARGYASVVHVLTRGPYRCDSTLIERITRAGASVGLHGLTHDYAIGARERQAIDDHLSTALAHLAALGQRPVWYRAPAFAVTARLAGALVDHGFRVDSSRTVFHPRYAGTMTTVPFMPVAGASLWECPVALEDSWLLRDWSLDAGAALQYCRDAIARAADGGGLLVVDTHPSVLAAAPAFYNGLLDAIESNSSAAVVSPGDVLATLTELCAA